MSDKETTHFGYQEVDKDDKADLVAGVFHSVAARYDLWWLPPCDRFFSVETHRTPEFGRLKYASPSLADSELQQDALTNQFRQTLRQLDEAGVRGVRFNFVKRLVDEPPRDELDEIAQRIAPLGWHIVIYFEAADLPGFCDFFASLPTTVVVDHMGRPDVSQPVDGPEFGRFLDFMASHPNVWSKVSCPERLSIQGPPATDGQTAPYTDVIPFAKRVVEAFPERVLWGTDWPHPNLKSHMPDDGLLVDFIPRIAATTELQRRLLVDNPLRLYWPELKDGLHHGD